MVQSTHGWQWALFQEIQANNTAQLTTTQPILQSTILYRSIAGLLPLTPLMLRLMPVTTSEWHGVLKSPYSVKIFPVQEEATTTNSYWRMAISWVIALVIAYSSFTDILCFDIAGRPSRRVYGAGFVFRSHHLFCAGGVPYCLSWWISPLDLDCLLNPLRFTVVVDIQNDTYFWTLDRLYHWVR